MTQHGPGSALLCDDMSKLCVQGARGGLRDTHLWHTKNEGTATIFCVWATYVLCQRPKLSAASVIGQLELMEASSANHRQQIA